MKTLLQAVVIGLLVSSGLTAFASDPSLIPFPRKFAALEGNFEIRADTRIRADGPARAAGEYLVERLREATGYPLKLGKSSKTQAAKGEVLMTTHVARSGGRPESYELIIAPDSVVISASDSAGLFYGAQTFLQLLPPEAFSAGLAQGAAWTVPCARVADEPRFMWRGYLLDVARHFFNKAELKQLIDLMALHKLNMLQLHLTDDQGWRVEIKRYPRLTQVGAWRKDVGFGLDPKSTTAYGADGRYGGYYTQGDIRELVAYARARQVTIVPEIEMPGHSGALLAAFPEISCTGGPYTTDVGGGVFAGVQCAGNEETFRVVENILSEVIELFPSSYIHIGGDEVPKENWQKCAKCQARMKQEGLKTEHELQSYFIRRIEKILNARGRNLIGWSEIREGGLAQNAAVMDWIGGAVEAAGAGHKVVMSPTGYCYFDYYQSTNHTTTEPRAIGGFLPLSQVYAFNPIPEKLDPKYASNIIGAQGNLWTEYIASFKHAQYMSFPRVCALAEVVWSPQESRNYTNFMARLQTHVRRLDRLGVEYRKASLTETP